MKIALLGGGGFRTPLAYAALESIAERAHVSEVVLHDIAADRLEHMRLVLDGLAEDSSRRLPVRVTTDLEEAVYGADFVWCAIRVGGLEGRLIDQNVPVREGVVGQETTGPGGICFALRSVPVLLDIARTVARAAPRAWFINFTNPIGLTTEALQQALGSRAIGVSDTPTRLSPPGARLIGRRPCQLRLRYFGLNPPGLLPAVLDNHRARACLP